MLHCIIAFLVLIHVILFQVFGEYYGKKSSSGSGKLGYCECEVDDFEFYLIKLSARFS